MSIDSLSQSGNKHRDMLEKISDFILYPIRGVWVNREVKIIEKDLSLKIQVVDLPTRYPKPILFMAKLVTCIPLAVGIILKKLDTCLNRTAKKYLDIMDKALKAKQKGYQDLEPINEIIDPIFDCTDSFIHVKQKTQHPDFCWTNVKFDLRKISRHGLQCDLMSLDEQKLIDRVKNIHAAYSKTIDDLEIELNELSK